MKKIIVIGASTGGPGSLEILFSQLENNFPASIIIAQHLASPFTYALAKRLNNDSSPYLKVCEARNGSLLDDGTAFVIPGNAHFFLVNPGPRITLIHSSDIQKPSVDMGLTSVAEHFGPNTIAVVLTGMGEDGVIGARAVKQLGGMVLVQDESTSVMYGMPKAIKDAGLADEELPLMSIMPRLVDLVTI